MNGDSKQKLNPEQYRVMRERDTERPYSGKYWDHNEGGLYSCAACGTVLFSSLAKVDVDNGHPTFTGPIDDESVVLSDSPHGTEISCKKCRGHIGHVQTPENGKEPLYITNSASFTFAPFPEIPEEEDGDENEKKHEKEKSALKKQIQNALVLLAAALTGAGVGYASGTALCQAPVATSSTLPTTAPITAAPTAAPSPTASTSRTPLPTPSPTPSPSPSKTPAPTVDPTASTSSDGTGTP